MNNDTLDIFYNLFWQHKGVQNLFLLSKIELLDSKELDLLDENEPIGYSLPRIILSNVVDKEDHTHEAVKFRNESFSLQTEGFIERTFQEYKPFVTDFLESKYGKPFEKLMLDFEEDSIKFILKGVKLLLADEKGREKIILDLLKEYNFIGKHIKDFTQLTEFAKKELIDKNKKTMLSESNLWTFREILKSVKDLYVSEAFKGLYNSNQVLINALDNNENFESRRHVFKLLYDSDIITSSKEDAFVECTNCKPGTFSGVMRLQMPPTQLEKITCPVCSEKVTYYVPYDLNLEIYKIVNSQDGLLQDALLNYLTANNIQHKANVKGLKDIEIDCVIELDKVTCVIECKMYKMDTDHRKIKQKFNDHTHKLLKVINRINSEPVARKDLKPILLVNINNLELLKEVSIDCPKEIEVMSLTSLIKYLNK